MLDAVSHNLCSRRELYFVDFIKYTFNINLHLDACEQISFQAFMLDQISQFDTSFVNLTFSQEKAKLFAVMVSLSAIEQPTHLRQLSM